MGCYCSATSCPPCSYCENSSACDKCDDIFHNDDMVVVGNEYLCGCCASDYACVDCAEHFEGHELTAYKGYNYCDDCMKKIRIQNINKKLFGH